MKQKGRGFTIVEVLIVLAVTGFLLVTASAVLRNQSTETAFQQSMRDIESKIGNLVKDVSNSVFPNASQYSCKTVSGRPVLKKEASGGLGSNQDCLFLGKALQVTVGQSTMYIYSVLGNRLKDGVPATTFDAAMPTPALDAAADLTETYSPSAGAALLLSAKYIDETGAKLNTEADLAGFYNDLEGNNATQKRLLVKAYEFTSTPGSPKQGIAACIEQQDSCARVKISHWLLCYQDHNKQRTALLDITASATGVTTKLSITACT